MEEASGSPPIDLSQLFWTSWGNQRGRWRPGGPLQRRVAFLGLLYSFGNHSPYVYRVVTTRVPISCCVVKTTTKPNQTGLWFGKEISVHSKAAGPSQWEQPLRSGSTTWDPENSNGLAGNWGQHWPELGGHCLSGWLPRSAMPAQRDGKSILQPKQSLHPFAGNCP